MCRQWWNPEKLPRIINNNISVLIVFMGHTIKKTYIRFPYFFWANVYLWVEWVIRSWSTHSIESGRQWQHSRNFSIVLTHSLYPNLPLRHFDVLCCPKLTVCLAKLMQAKGDCLRQNFPHQQKVIMGLYQSEFQLHHHLFLNLDEQLSHTLILE